jgi:hypothetical protein
MVGALKEKKNRWPETGKPVAVKNKWIIKKKVSLKTNILII